MKDKLFETRFVPDRDNVSVFIDDIFNIVRERIILHFQEERGKSILFPININVYAKEAGSLSWLGGDTLFRFTVYDYRNPDNNYFDTNRDNVYREDFEPDSYYDLSNAEFDGFFKSVDKVEFYISFFLKLEGESENVYLIRLKNKLRHELDHIYGILTERWMKSESFKRLNFINKFKGLYNKILTKMKNESVRFKLYERISLNENDIYNEIIEHRMFMSEELKQRPEMPYSYKKMLSKINLINIFFNEGNSNTGY